MRKLLYLVALLMPWKVRRWILIKVFHFDIHPSARITLAWVMPKRLVMAANSRIGPLTVCKDLDLIHLDLNARIGRLNWISGFPTGTKSKHFAHQTDRVPELRIGAHSAITNRHIIDCTNKVHIGRYTTFAGYASQILTHSIDLVECHQSSKPVTIGDYCFIGTNAVILGGSVLPDRCVLGAKALLQRAYDQPLTLYAGVPAKPVKELPADWKYFTREVGFVI